MPRNRGLTDHIREVQAKREKALFIGEVSEVHTKEGDEPEQGNIEVNVQDVGGESELRKVPFTATDHPGHVTVPEVGDTVVVDYVKGRGRTPVAVGLSPDDRDEKRSPNAKEGHWRHEWAQESGDNLYLEAEPSDHSGGTPDVVRMGIKSGGLEDATTEISVDNSGDEPEIKLNTDGKVTVDCDTIELGSGSLASVLNENAVIEYVGGGDNSSTRTANITDPGTDNVDAS